MIRAAILGATGYTAVELVKILLRHPHVQITACTTRQDGSPPLQSLHPSLAGRIDLPCENLSPQQVASRADVVFCALPHVASMEVVPHLLAAGCRVIDLSADYRLRDPATYQKWYGHEHTDTANLAHAVYGLPELWADRIPAAKLVANPGCYTSASILGLAPLLAAGLVDAQRIIINAGSGVSGAGRTPKLNTLYCEANEGVTPYSIGYAHRHAPEIEQILGDVSGRSVEVIFSPHLIPMDRGICATIYAPLLRETSDETLKRCYREFYANKPFMRLSDRLPSTKDSANTNFCDIAVQQARGQAIVVSCLDNLIKGASGVAVQNFNLMFGFPETTALL